ncbi:D-glycero-beta-D-manno-heptose 1,7-bisphosphate 7-phosphatase [Carboxylicivirga sp. M1479]|uniref:D-glycero-alpha-D-manno-heptose-1,7-bisphosphate 7-phosphatase n=1 Tax=Carboxylicivirga sp. M1479 TaxID=2594476 RepID=UPI001177F6F2|nr:HAD family hydrolase [Carboxylicivirga sp. M1479]TRX70885.1 HAD family hydrolase [Carboxylicivirga sp. M1479]
MKNKAVFIDRDGVINNDEGHYYIYKTKDFKINNGIVEGLQLLQKAGYKLFIITNQGGIAKGEYSEDDVEKVHGYFLGEMFDEDIRITDIYYCPHHSDIEACDCRKPSPGMILQAIDEHQIDKSKSFLIGDSDRDIEAGEAACLKQCFKIESNSSIVSICKQITGL